MFKQFNQKFANLLPQFNLKIILIQIFRIIHNKMKK